jgi:hypothetical protein
MFGHDDDNALARRAAKIAKNLARGFGKVFDYV